MGISTDALAPELVIRAFHRGFFNPSSFLSPPTFVAWECPKNDIEGDYDDPLHKENLIQILAKNFAKAFNLHLPNLPAVWLKDLNTDQIVPSDVKLTLENAKAIHHAVKTARAMTFCVASTSTSGFLLGWCLNWLRYVLASPSSTGKGFTRLDPVLELVSVLADRIEIEDTALLCQTAELTGQALWSTAYSTTASKSLPTTKQLQSYITNPDAWAKCIHLAQGTIENLTSAEVAQLLLTKLQNLPQVRLLLPESSSKP